MKGFLQGLKFPLKLLVRLFSRKRSKIKDERRENQVKHVRNFDSARLKNVSYQKRTGRKLNEGQKERKRKRKKRKFSNNSKG